MKFRTFLEDAESLEGEVNHLIDSAGHVLFFKKGKELFGAGEDSRVIFARMKHPDEETPKEWAKDASFSAQNLNKAVRGEPSQHVISNDDLKKIKVIDRDEVVKDLAKEAESLGDKAFPKRQKFQLDLSRIFQRIQNPDDPPNFVRADEE